MGEAGLLRPPRAVDLSVSDQGVLIETGVQVEGDVIPTAQVDVHAEGQGAHMSLLCPLTLVPAPPHPVQRQGEGQNDLGVALFPKSPGLPISAGQDVA